MSLRRVCVLIAIALGVSDVNAQNRTKETCGIQATNNQYPWLVGIRYEYNEEPKISIDCSGVLVSRQYVISNAECFDLQGFAKSVLLGPISKRNCTKSNSEANCTESDDDVVVIPIEKIIKHPEFSGTDDIALIKLREKVTYTDAIRPICLPRDDLMRSVDKELYYTGLDADNQYKKLYAAATYLNNTECQDFPFISTVAEDEVCAKTIDKINVGRDCITYGSFLMNKREDKYELIGVIGSRSRCEVVKVFTYVYPYLDWIRSEIPDWAHECGKRKIKHVELIESGRSSKAGDWPWHAAIYRSYQSSVNYICGGTIISKEIVLTAAHCVTTRGKAVSPEILTVVLGKYFLVDKEIQSQERQIDTVIVHESFSPTHYFNNDIALLKLKTQCKYDDYVQPACIWYSEAYDRLPGDRNLGTVIGWGRDQSEELSSQLKHASIPKVSYEACVEKDQLYYVNVLKNKKKFCAGWANGTSPCNGDSGGGFFVFVPDTKYSTSEDSGSWYVRGIVSMTVSIRISHTKVRCDPYKYVVFTDVDKYTGWIKRYLEN